MRTLRLLVITVVLMLFFSAFASIGATIKFKWDPPPSSNDPRYQIIGWQFEYVGIGHSEEGHITILLVDLADPNNPEYIVNNVPLNKIWEVRLLAVNVFGIVSLPTEKLIVDTNPPPSPTGFNEGI